MPNLDSLLAFPSEAGGSGAATPIPPFSSHVLVTDTLDSPALFVLVHFLRAAHAINKSSRSAAEKGKGKSEDIGVIWIGCNDDGIGHLKNIARKSGVQLDVEAQKGSFAYFDAFAPSSEDSEAVSTRMPDGETTSPATLRSLYQSIKRQLEQKHQDTPDSWTSGTVIIVDDLSSLSWSLSHIDAVGRPVDVAAQINTWLQALDILALKHRASLITLCHADATSLGKHTASDATDEAILRSTLLSADVWVEVKELISGRARDCDGEITVHSLVRPSLGRSVNSQSDSTQTRSPLKPPPLEAFKIETPCPNRSKAVLYRIAPDGQNAALGGSGANASTGRVHVWARGTGRGFL